MDFLARLIVSALFFGATLFFGFLISRVPDLGMPFWFTLPTICVLAGGWGIVFAGTFTTWFVESDK